MLEKVDLSRRIEKEDYKAALGPLRERLGYLQRKIKDDKTPVIVVFEGWDGAGKGVLMNELIQAIDPRWFDVYNVAKEAVSEKYWPPMRRFWEIMPERGTIGLYNRSWYRRVLDVKLDEVQDSAYEQLISFERQLAQDGCVIVKFFLHIDKKEQKKRLKALEADKSSNWRVSKQDWANHKRYDKTLAVVENCLHRTDTDFAPWTLVEAHQKEFAVIKILNTVIRAIENNMAKSDLIKSIDVPNSGIGDSINIDKYEPSILANLDLDKSVPKYVYKKELDILQSKIKGIQYQLYHLRRPMVIVFEGMDAGGKGGCIRRLTQKMDPRGYQVSPTSAPNDMERAYQYLRRFWVPFPKAGHVGIYDRSWYGRVLVERVEGFATESQWRRAFNEINDMEKQWAEYGAIIMKFWLQISQDEQMVRFKAREANEDKTWKITEEDWRNREKWPLYEPCAEEMFLRTSTPHAPWFIVGSNCKEYARLEVLTHVIDTCERCGVR